MIKFFFKKNLNAQQKIEFDKIASTFKKDLKLFRQKDLRILRALQLSSILCLTFNTILIQQGVLYYWFEILPFFSSIFFTYRVYKREYDFLLNYDFGKINSVNNIFKFFSFSLKSNYIVTIGTLTLSGLTVVNYAVSEVTGYSVLQDFGMRTGLHKDSPKSIWKKED